MEKVTGIGGVFFRAADPQGLSAWYQTHLGVQMDFSDGPWRQAAGPTVFAPFKLETEYFGRPDQQWMINFRVENLELMIAQLAAADIEVTLNPAWDAPEVGRFARIHDPEGNPIELWEPAPETA